MGVALVATGLMAGSAGNHAGGALFGLGTMAVILGGTFVIMLVAVVLMGGLFRMAIKQLRGEPIHVSDLWSVTDVIWKLVGAAFLIGLAVSVSTLACYLPAFIVGGLLMLTIPLIVDQKMGVIEAMSRSWNALKQDWLMAAVLYFLLNIIGTLGVVAIYIGMLFTYPIFILGTALVYRDFILGGSIPPPSGPQPYGSSPYPTNVTPGAYPPEMYAPQQPPPPPPTELR